MDMLKINGLSLNKLRGSSDICLFVDGFSSIFLAKIHPSLFFFKILFFGLCFLVPQYFFVLCNKKYIKPFSFQAFFITIWARKLFYFFSSHLNFLKRIFPSPLTLHQNIITTHMADGGFKFLCSLHPPPSASFLFSLQLSTTGGDI